MATYSTSGRIQTSVVASDERTDDVGTAIDAINMRHSSSFTDGTGDGEINLIARHSFSIVGPFDGGLFITDMETLFDAGNKGFATIKALSFQNMATDPADAVRVGVTNDDGSLLSTPFNSDGEELSYVEVHGGGFVMLTSPLTGWSVGSAVGLGYAGDSTFDIEVVLFGVAA